ncbi:Granulocyte-macrophage colony-stimulating factor receptor subunit alpha [Camelus dromedarius]|uniref:Granulocyte-macrophage colony-stimulating factor receptor subunit alpha n=1 Tax=Camelus dromedarius TaxID=9838 RepID=A0A5N4C1M8_CAMDR|nr:Granulocyte-macrophage colony-stimulating factor receptor subunit alpha [Camelus dromedarius]
MRTRPSSQGSIAGLRVKTPRFSFPPVLPRPVGSPTCLLVITILLSLLLDPAFLLTQGHQDETMRKGERECPHYLTDAGTNVGCHLQDLSGLTSYNYFLVNGTSRETGIQFFDSILLLKEIERYSPPHNITVNCNESHCLVRWEKPRTRKNWSNREFQYQLDIWRQIVVSGDSENRYNFPSPEPRGTQMVKIRTADARRAHWGDWSQPVQFGSEEPESSLVLVYVLVVLGTLAGGLACGCLFKRFLGSHSLFPPIPRIRDKLKDDHQIDHQILSEKFTCDAEMGDKEEILTVTEVAEAPASP